MTLAARADEGSRSGGANGRARRGAVVLALLLCASCSRCGAPAARDAAELLPSRWTAAVSTAPLGPLSQRASAALALAATIPGGDALQEQVRGISTQLGLDLLSREGLLAAGLDPERGAALALLEPAAGDARAPWIAALPLSNPSTFAQKLETTLLGRAGYPLRVDEVRGSVHCVVFSRASAGPRIGYAVVRGYGVLARGPDPSQLIAEAAARTLDKSLAADPRLTQARTELDHPDVIALSTSGNPLLARLSARALPGKSALGLTLLPDGARVRLTQDLPTAQSAQLHALFAASGATERFETPQTPLTLRVNAVPAQLPALLGQAPQLRAALEGLRQTFAQGGADLDRDLFAALSPGASLAIDLAPAANLGRALDPAALDLRAHSPFDIVRLYATAAARDPDFGAARPRGAGSRAARGGRQRAALRGEEAGARRAARRVDQQLSGRRGAPLRPLRSRARSLRPARTGAHAGAGLRARRGRFVRGGARRAAALRDQRGEGGAVRRARGAAAPARSRRARGGDRPAAGQRLRLGPAGLRGPLAGLAGDRSAAAAAPLRRTPAGRARARRHPAAPGRSGTRRGPQRRSPRGQAP